MDSIGSSIVWGNHLTRSSLTRGAARGCINGKNVRAFAAGRAEEIQLARVGTGCTFRGKGSRVANARRVRLQKSTGTVRAQAKPWTESEVETLEKMREGKLGEHPDRHSISRVKDLDLTLLNNAAAHIRDRRIDSSIITFSPKVFIPLTRVCRDVCGYCTFALGPTAGQPVYMTLEDVLKIARDGVAAGCSEVLFTLGDKPELRYPQAKNELLAMGYHSTISYVAAVAKTVLQKTGLLPHINAGVMGREDVAALRQVSVSQGLMLESISERLLEPGGPHYNCPDKRPSARLATIAAAGVEKVPFTSGLLIGIGETREERVESLFALRDLHARYGHIQELIIQNFCAKKGTRMQNAAEPSIEDLQWTIAMARLIFGSSMSIQAPPNLAPNMCIS